MNMYATIGLDYDQIRSALAQYVKAQYGIDVEPDKIVVVPTNLSISSLSARVDVSDRVILERRPA